MKKAKGFTLIELMIVVAILGILAAVAIPKFAELIRKANEGATKGNLAALRGAVTIYFGQMEAYPVIAEVGADIPELVPIFIEEVPRCNIAGWHPVTTAIVARNHVGYVAAAVHDSRWVYDGGDAADFDAAFLNSANGARNWGKVWVGCITCTDTRQTDWNTF